MYSRPGSHMHPYHYRTCITLFRLSLYVSVFLHGIPGTTPPTSFTRMLSGVSNPPAA